MNIAFKSADLNEPSLHDLSLFRDVGSSLKT